jgi:hypothetical protein
MPVALSRGARTLFRACLTGEQTGPPFDEIRFYRQLEKAGLVRPSEDGAGFRLTEEGEARRWEFLPHPDGPSSEAMELWRRLVGDERVDVYDDNRSAFRELAAAGLMAACHTFAKGDDSLYRMTEEGYARKMKLLGKVRESA